LWGDTALELPFLPQGARLRNLFTGQELDSSGGSLTLARILADVPVAALAY
jgi:maltooligosyltrehalose synthase